MKKIMKVIAGTILLLLLIPPTLSKAAAERPRLVDEAALLTEEENRVLLARLDEISENTGLDLVVVTVTGLGESTPEEYADDFYDYSGYGLGENDDGILLLISMEERDWAISTHGFGITAFTDAGQEYMVDQFMGKVGDGEYAEAFNKFADLCEELIVQAKEGCPYDAGQLPKGAPSPYLPLYAIACGALIALLTVSLMKGQLKSVRMQGAAENYVKANSLNIAVSRDLFLYSTLSRIKTEKPKSTSTGSSTHISSSGRKHGGSSGKF